MNLTGRGEVLDMAVTGVVGRSLSFNGIVNIFVAYLLRDEFTTADAAPVSSPRTAEPGPGTLTVVDTDNKSSIASGALHLAPHSTPAWGDPGAWGGALARACGRAMLARVTPAATNTYFQLGWHDSTSGEIDFQSLRLYSDGKVDSFQGGAIAAADIATYTAAQQDIAVILRDTGAYYLRRTAADWDLLWADDTEATATLYPGTSNYNATLDADWLRVTDLPAPFNTQYALATFRDADAVAASTTFAHEADFVMRFTATTLPSGNSIQVWFRKQDATHAWYVYVDSSGNLRLVKHDPVLPLIYIEALGALSGGEVITVIADDTTIMLYYDATRAGITTSASDYKTETDGEVATLGTAGAISDLVTYPRTMSGAAATALIQAGA